MRVNDNINYYNDYKTTSKSNDEFSDILVHMSAISQSQPDSVEGFRQNIAQNGIMAAINMMNSDRIKEQIDLKRAELLKALDTHNMSPKDKAAALASVEDSLDRYKKDLQERRHDFETKSLEDDMLKKLLTLV